MLPLQADERFEVEVRARQAILMIQEAELERTQRELQQEKDKVIRCVVLSMNKENDYLKMRSATYIGLNQYFHAGICIYAEFVVVFSKFIEFLV